MLVRFTGIGCTTCTQTIDFDKIRAIGMLKNTDSYYVRLSFENGNTLTTKSNMTLSQAISYRNTLEGYWLSSVGGFSAFKVEDCLP